MLIGVDDFQLACEDLLVEAPVTLFDQRKAEKPICPRCTKPMGVCRVKVKDKKLPGEFSFCERDGLWFGRDVLSGVFATLTRKYLGYVGGQRGRSSYDLSIQSWRDRPRKRDKTLTPVNAYRDQTLLCPACRSSPLRFYGDRYGCDQCRGCFVQTAALEGLVAEMTGEPWSIPAAAGGFGERSCPICAAALVVETMSGVKIDRCPIHGVWFDPQELETVLQHSVETLAGRPAGLVGWLKRLF
jgi:Zn-finger nucleic acid-binding protein